MVQENIHAGCSCIGQTAILNFFFYFISLLVRKAILSSTCNFYSTNKATLTFQTKRMERYNMIKEVGDGTFGSVWRAINKQTGQIVAVKKMKKKFFSWEECINLREVKSLRKMSHPNIVKLREVIRENDILYFVFEYMDCNLYQLMKDRPKPFSEADIKNWCFQVFQGLAYMHQRGYFHRDLKPENLLVSKDIIKVADFGLAREVNSQPPYTEYVSTRWYRAPEVLLQSPIYNPAVDMWAMGAIMAELFTLRPLFPGSSEADELYKICSVIGTPTEIEWYEGLKLATAINYQFPQLPGVHLPLLIPSASVDAISLVKSLCSWDPCKRPSASVVLQHPFFQSCFYIPPSLRSGTAVIRTPPSALARGAVEQKSTGRYTGNLTNSKTANNFTSAKTNIPLTAGVQRKLEMNNNQDAGKNDKFSKVVGKQTPRYRPPARNSKIYNGKSACGVVADTTVKLANMSVGGGARRSLSARQSFPAPMKAGGWHNRSDDFLAKTNQNPAKPLTREVAG